MTRKSALLTFVVFVLALSFVLIGFQSLSATPVPGETPDIILKINDLEKHLDIIDQVFGGGQAQPGDAAHGVVRQRREPKPHHAVRLARYLSISLPESLILEGPVRM